MWSRLESLGALLENDGLVLVAKEGQGRLHPALRLETQLTAEYIKIAAAFGATPRGRVGLAAEGQPLADDARKARFFRSPPPQP